MGRIEVVMEAQEISGFVINLVSFAFYASVVLVLVKLLKKRKGGDDDDNMFV